MLIIMQDKHHKQQQIHKGNTQEYPPHIKIRRCSNANEKQSPWVLRQDYNKIQQDMSISDDSLTAVYDFSKNRAKIAFSPCLQTRPLL